MTFKQIYTKKNDKLIAIYTGEEINMFNYRIFEKNNHIEKVCHYFLGEI